MRWLGHAPYFATIVLMMVGLYIVIARENLVKKMMGLNIFQVSVIMFYVAMGNVDGGTAPILVASEAVAVAEPVVASEAVAVAEPVVASEAVVVSEPAPESAGPAREGAESAVAADRDDARTTASPTPSVASGLRPAAGVVYSNPLPHVLMLTAIVVGVATTALGLSFIVRIYEDYGEVEEDAIAQAERSAEHVA
jgi:multicomponent Na+:H+ antiporter subunit C